MLQDQNLKLHDVVRVYPIDGILTTAAKRRCGEVGVKLDRRARLEDRSNLCRAILRASVDQGLVGRPTDSLVVQGSQCGKGIFVFSIKRVQVDVGETFGIAENMSVELRLEVRRSSPLLVFLKELAESSLLGL